MGRDTGNGLKTMEYLWPESKEGRRLAALFNTWRCSYRRRRFVHMTQHLRCCCQRPRLCHVLRLGLRRRQDAAAPCGAYFAFSSRFFHFAASLVIRSSGLVVK